jgi:16S rRNA C1402 N4-methylase RsmH
MKTIYPSKEEVEENLASRSAKLRILIKKHE